MMRASLAMAAVMLVLGLAACGRGAAGGDDGAATAEAIAHHDCAACGMLVRDQSSPRAQLVHRDGTRAFFCSVADLVAYLEAPSPHGRVRAVFVEGMAPEADPLTFDPSPRPWLAVEAARYVLGVPKERVMGLPILVYASADDAQRIAGAHDGEVTDWAGARGAARAAIYKEEQ